MQTTAVPSVLEKASALIGCADAFSNALPISGGRALGARFERAICWSTPARVSWQVMHVVFCECASIGERDVPCPA